MLAICVRGERLSPPLLTTGERRVRVVLWPALSHVLTYTGIVSMLLMMKWQCCGFSTEKMTVVWQLIAPTALVRSVPTEIHDRAKVCKHSRSLHTQALRNGAAVITIRPLETLEIRDDRIRVLGMGSPSGAVIQMSA
ncbi:hypothetical protein PYCCODRAFT_1186096 [Trametes coccinea BRFM310]|uniref:Uncharacterized protein n=1 Tax=Trametes coccinea (strain BRFM310) TaxID=1353009 RepID=A0A1Y2I7X0_TRAC3|nr:hypothetical protein PYCCODRAFT_1186096 [Trametes coccinea BRFM310]